MQDNTLSIYRRSNDINLALIALLSVVPLQMFHLHPPYAVRAQPSKTAPLHVYSTCIGEIRFVPLWQLLASHFNTLSLSLSLYFSHPVCANWYY